MSENKLYKKVLRTEETIEPPTMWLIKRGVTQVGHTTEVYIEEQEDGSIRVCSGSVVNYYYEGERIDRSYRPLSCVTIPAELVLELHRQISMMMC